MPLQKEPSQQKVKSIIAEMKKQGALPAINENIQEISKLTVSEDTGASDLTSVILRDAGLTTNILTVANSALYSPKYSIKTISVAVTFLGFERVRSLALALSFFKKSFKSLKSQKLSILYISSYFSGSFAMSLGREKGVKNPEEIFVSGLLYRLPILALANTYPEKYRDMEKIIFEEKVSQVVACQRVFGVDYHDLCSALTDVYNLPESVNTILKDVTGSDPITQLVRSGSQISAMLFGNKLGGEKAIAGLEERLEKLLHKKIKLTEFIQSSCEKDGNISRFFNLDKSDVDMMTKALEWGKGNPSEIASRIHFGDSLVEDAETEQEDVDALIGHFFTEIMLCKRKGKDINQALMLTQEALVRCITKSEVVLSFFDKNKQTLLGKFYTGSRSSIKPNYFNIPVTNVKNQITEALRLKMAMEWSVGDGTSLGMTHMEKSLNLTDAAFSPIVVHGNVIGLCFVGRSDHREFDDKEIVWLEQLTQLLSGCFERQLKH